MGSPLPLSPLSSLFSIFGHPIFSLLILLIGAAWGPFDLRINRFYSLIHLTRGFDTLFGAKLFVFDFPKFNGTFAGGLFRAKWYQELLEGSDNLMVPLSIIHLHSDWFTNHLFISTINYSTDLETEQNWKENKLDNDKEPLHYM